MLRRRFARRHLVLGVSAGGALIIAIGVIMVVADLRTADESLRQITYEGGGAADSIAPHTSTPYGITTTDEVALLGTQAGMALLKPGDPQWKETKGFRAEWHGIDTVPLGVERWHGLNLYLPEDWHQGVNDKTSDRRIVFQFHTSGGPGWSPIYGLLITGDESNPSWALYRKEQYTTQRDTIGYRNEILWEQPANEEDWINFAIHVMWTTDDSGFIELYRDRTLVYSERDIRTMNDEAAKQGPYSKWGIYGQPTRLLFDEVRIAEGPDQLDAVAPRVLIDG